MIDLTKVTHTRDGRSVKHLENCTHSSFPISGQYEESPGKWVWNYWRADGLNSSYSADDPLDLVEAVETEKHWTPLKELSAPLSTLTLRQHVALAILNGYAAREECVCEDHVHDAFFLADKFLEHK